MAEAKFQVGDRVIVTGDTQMTSHEIDDGSEAVVLLTENTVSRGFGYFVSVQHTPEQALAINWPADEDAKSDVWTEMWVIGEVEWVGEEDLKPAEEPTENKVFFGPVGTPNEALTDVASFIASAGFVPTTKYPSAEEYFQPHEDVVNKPNHYTQGLPEGVEVIDIIKAQGWLEQFVLGNVTKYVLRAQYKGTYRQDIQKAHKYLSMLLDSWEDDGDG